MTLTMRPIARMSEQCERGEIRRGFVAMIPLWAGLVPFAVAFATVARAAGLSTLETLAFSMLVCAGSAQLAAVTLISGGVGALPIVFTAAMLNLRHVLYGLSLNAHLPETPRPPRSVLAFFLTDEAYGLTIKDSIEGRGGGGFLLGAGLSLYLTFSGATLTGALLGGFLPDPERTGLDIVFPLSFLALLIPLLRGWRPVLVAGLAVFIALLLTHGVGADSGTTILISTVAAASLGAGLDARLER